MTISSVNKTNIQNQLKNQSKISLTPSTSAWMKAISDSLSISEIKPLSQIASQAYSLNISQRGLKEMEKYDKNDVAIFNSEVLSYTKNLTLKYKDF